MECDKKMEIIIKKSDIEQKYIDFFNIKPNKYIIDNYGNIYNYKYKKMKPYIDKDGYQRIELVTNNGPKKFYVHRLVAYAFVEGYSEKLVVNHKNSIRLDNYYENLEWVSIKENNKHGFIHGFVDYTATSETRRLNKVYEIKDVELYCDYISKGFSNKEILDICKYTDKKQRRRLQLLLNDLRNKKSWVWVSNKYF